KRAAANTFTPSPGRRTKPGYRPGLKTAQRRDRRQGKPTGQGQARKVAPGKDDAGTRGSEGRRPMAKQEAFLRAIAANPDDDAPRLIFADWLEENGDPERAEFIRTQCALASSNLSEKRRHTLRVRERELLEARRREWRQAFDLP